MSFRQEMLQIDPGGGEGVEGRLDTRPEAVIGDMEVSKVRGYLRNETADGGDVPDDLRVGGGYEERALPGAVRVYEQHGGGSHGGILGGCEPHPCQVGAGEKLPIEGEGRHSAGKTEIEKLGGWKKI